MGPHNYLVIRGLNVVFYKKIKQKAGKVTSSSTDYQTFPTLFELEPVAGNKL